MAAATSCPHPLEYRVGALIVPKVEVQTVLRSLPRGALRDGRNCTPYRGRDCTERMALHVSHAAAVALDSCTNVAALLGELVTLRLRSGELRWEPGLRAFSERCRTRLEDELLATWRSLCFGSGNSTFRFVELFAGIGGFRLGLQPLGGRCVLAVEVDEGAREIYRENFGEDCLSDVVALDPADVPEHDVLTAGFPCQPFARCNTDNACLTGSLSAGPGIRDGKRGALAFEVVRVVRAARPAAFLLENVPNLCDFNGGEDLATLVGAMHDAGYSVHTRVLDARQFGVQQQRKRLYFVGFRSDLPYSATSAFSWPDPPWPEQQLPLRTVLEPVDSVPRSCWLSEATWAAMLQDDPRVCLPSGRGGRLARLDGYARTLTSTYRTKGGWYSELVPSVEAGSVAPGMPSQSEEMECAGSERPPVPPLLLPPPPRFFTHRECCRLQGFPEDFVLRSRRATARNRTSERFYHFIGNAVVPPVVRALGESLLGVLLLARGGDENARRTEERFGAT